MAHSYRPWTLEEVSTLTLLAGRQSPDDIAKLLGRSGAATRIKAHELKLSMRRPVGSSEGRNWSSPLASPVLLPAELLPADPSTSQIASPCAEPLPETLYCQQDE
jgi:hypothetical protein